MTMPTANDFYTASSRRLQDENDSRKLADAVAHAIVDDELRPEQAGFIGSLDYFFLTTINEKGEPTVSYKGGPVGLAHVVNLRKIVFRNYDGNGMFLSMGNVAATSKVGLLFIDMVTPLRVRVQGEARLTQDADHLARFPGSNMIVEIDITSVFYNCARYIHKHSRLETGTVARLGVRRRSPLAGRDRWLAGTSVRSRSRACHCRHRRTAAEHQLHTALHGTVWVLGHRALGTARKSRRQCQRQGDCRKIGGQAAVAIGGQGSLAGWNFCPKPEPSVPL